MSPLFGKTQLSHLLPPHIQQLLLLTGPNPYPYYYPQTSFAFFTDSVSVSISARLDYWAKAYRSRNRQKNCRLSWSIGRLRLHRLSSIEISCAFQMPHWPLPMAYVSIVKPYSGTSPGALFLAGQIIAGFLDRFGNLCSDHDIWSWGSAGVISHSLMAETIVGFLDRYGQPCSDYLSESSMTTSYCLFGICPFFDGRNIVGFLDRFGQPYSDYYIDLEDVRILPQRKHRQLSWSIHSSRENHRGLRHVPFLDGEHTALLVDTVGCARIIYQNQKRRRHGFSGVCWGKRYLLIRCRKRLPDFIQEKESSWLWRPCQLSIHSVPPPIAFPRIPTSHNSGFIFGARTTIY